MDAGLRVSELVSEARQALEYDLDNAAHLVQVVVESDQWKEFDTPLGRAGPYKNFDAFCKAPPPKGWGYKRGWKDVEKRISFDTMRLAKIARHIGYNITKSPQDGGGGTGRRQALLRLADHRPDLLARVEAEELSPHAAMVQAGFRHRTISVPVDDIDATARALQRHLSNDALTELITRLES